MIPATHPVQRPPDAKVLVVDPSGAVADLSRRRIVEHFRRGDLVVANDAATLPASLYGIHRPTGAGIEVRLAGRRSLSPDDVGFSAVVFGEGDYHTRTEHRPAPPALAPGDLLSLGPLQATVTRLLGHPRLFSLQFTGSAHDVWAGVARHGRPIQYAHIAEPLALWDIWTPIAARPVAFEPPSAGFVIDWAAVSALHRRGVEFATITHAAGISSTGDPELDARLPLDEPYEVAGATARAIERARAERRRIVAIGTTVVRALEHSAAIDGVVHSGPGIATGRIGPRWRLRVVDAIVTGVHEPDTSHYQLLGAFVSDAVLRRAEAVMDARAYRTHEFGDSMFVEVAADRRDSQSI